MKISTEVSIRGAIKPGSKGEAVALIQMALISAGHQLVVDGDFGAITVIGVKKFQSAHSLIPDGIVGAKTAASLDAATASTPVIAQPLASVKDFAPHLAIMRALNGTAEIPGARSNPLILGWRDSIIKAYPDLRRDLSWYVDDDTPWCGLVVGFCIATSGFRPPAGLLAAIHWATWGINIDPTIPGAILIFKRKGGHHVAFSEGANATHFHIDGGNQKNQVNVRRKLKNELIASRWPSTLPLPPYGPHLLDASGDVSINEA